LPEKRPLAANLANQAAPEQNRSDVATAMDSADGCNSPAVISDDFQGISCTIAGASEKMAQDS
jgi:hypothetical protein